MSDLTAFRDHCRAMAEHTRDTVVDATAELRGTTDKAIAADLKAAITRNAGDHVLWTALADEADAFLDRDTPTADDEPLWETP